MDKGRANTIAFSKRCVETLPKSKNMKTVETEARSMDDLIFENRNHAYGAYALRKAYPSNVNRAAAVALGLAAALTALSFIHRDRVDLPVIVPEHPPFTFDKNVTVIPDYKPVQPARRQRTQGTLTPVATANPVQEVITPEDNKPFISGSDTGTELNVSEGPVTGDAVVETVEAAPVVDDKVYLHTEVAAQYAGGMAALAKFMSKNVKYPAIARRIGVEGTVYVGFIVGKSGEILEATVIKGIDAACDAEALRVINLMKGWSPGLQGGAPVKVRMVLPITFKLAGS
jgi:protein TonB